MWRRRGRAAPPPNSKWMSASAVKAANTVISGMPSVVSTRSRRHIRQRTGVIA